MKTFGASLLILALFGSAISHKQWKKHSDSSSYSGLDAIVNASNSNYNTAGQTSAIGQGNTSISSSVGKKGTINNLKSCKGGKAAQSFQQVGDEHASSTRFKRGKNGKIVKIGKASHNNYNLKGANQNAFAGQGASSSGTGKNGVISNVHGKLGAANADSWNKVEKNKASAVGFKKANKKKNHCHDHSSQSSSSHHTSGHSCHHHHSDKSSDSHSHSSHSNHHVKKHGKGHAHKK